MVWLDRDSPSEALTVVEDAMEHVATNVRMLQSVIDAHNLLCPNLRFVAMPGGTLVSITTSRKKKKKMQVS